MNRRDAMKAAACGVVGVTNAELLTKSPDDIALVVSVDGLSAPEYRELLAKHVKSIIGENCPPVIVADSRVTFHIIKASDASDNRLTDDRAEYYSKLMKSGAFSVNDIRKMKEPKT